jgi:hydrogenase/urease accessory protein HupE
MKGWREGLALATLVCACAAAAHDSRPVFIRVEVQEGGNVLLGWKVPDSVPQQEAPQIVLDRPCSATGVPGSNGEAPDEPRKVRSLQGLRWFGCPARDAPISVRIEWPGPVPSLATLIRHSTPEGGTRTIHVAPGETLVELAATPSTPAVFREYFTLGVEHILAGYDHLLFVACLVFIAGNLRSTLLAVTGFTMAHSVTLAGAALDVVSLPIPPVETVIALSIVFLAAELARNRRDTLTWRYPMVVAAAFGLLHGFGFAAVLDAIGLPVAETPAALVSFNAGVEAGQLVFVALLVTVLPILRRTLPRLREDRPGDFHVARTVAYPIGVLAMFWTLERLAGFG